MKYPRFLLLPVLAACGLAAGGCGDLGNIIPPAQADPTRYFLLAPGQGGGAEAVPAAVIPGRLRVGFRRVELASFLRTRSIVVDSGPNEIAIEDFRRWAEPLGDAISRIMRARLLADPAVASVEPQPFAFDADRDCDVAITILHCEGVAEPGGRSFARFAADYEVVTPGPEPRIIARGTFTAPEAPWDGRDYGKLAEALYISADSLGRLVATEINGAGITPAPQPPAQAR
jgi:uncharacterized lipoprotein YmbA